MVGVQNTEHLQIFKMWSQPSCHLAVGDIVYENLFLKKSNIKSGNEKPSHKALSFCS